MRSMIESIDRIQAKFADPDAHKFFIVTLIQSWEDFECENVEIARNYL